MCKELMLIIEVDGVTHQWSEVADADIKRGRILCNTLY
jgi:very-short-patch-repair endonuclease